ncbi:winged helix-turn-helix domain-containing protein [Parasphingorhabdus sp.]|uniref:winged helix-turn-helix domain-containing protein n=1 Tax=Parasphingorhabdus sp. TaxID=2709688 RepID=UPI003265339D
MVRRAVMHYVLRDLSIDTETRTVRRDAIAIKLPDLSFDALITLMEAAPDPVSIADFSRAVWRAEHVSDETVAQRIALLRKALGDDPKNPLYIRTVRGAGYAVAGSVERLEDRPKPKSILNRRNSIAATLGLMALLVAGALFLTSRDTGFQVQMAESDAGPKSLVMTLVDRAQEQLGLHQARETDRAITMLREALAQDPNSFDARMTLSFALSTKATKFDGGPSEKTEAEALARALIEEQPDSSNAWSALGYSLGSQGRVNESLSALQYAYQLDPENAPAASSAAYVHLMRGELYQALELEFQVRRTGGASRYAEIQIAQSLELVGHPATSRWHEKALSLNPGQIVILSEIAKSHLRHGRPDAALETLAQTKGDDQSAPQISALRGRANIALGHIERARSLLEAAGWRGQYDLAALDAVSGDGTRAEKLLHPSKQVDMESDPDPGIRIQLAEVAAALGRQEDALRLLSQAVNLGWRDADWLNQSPFLAVLMSSSKGRQLESRIVRELEAQRRLIEGSKELSLAIAD